ARVVGAITRYLYAPEEMAAVHDALVDDATRLVTLTVTADGYAMDPRGVLDGRAAAGHGDLRDPASPATAIGLVTESLVRRRALGRRPFTVLSCDNLPASGMVTRTAVLSSAAMRDARLARWIDESVSFPDCMVDRITPGTTDEDRRRLSACSASVTDGR
ncbi:MAG: mannitol dehydrogenase family protein, partial [Actinomycetota bacterium]|nr:mannitol dehydrogenase family protein [Actinomycetota bacterium]